MKRSTVNEAIDWAIGLLARENWKLPAYSLWTPEEWRKRREDCAEIGKTMLGWDVTDYGLDDFRSVGGVLYTIRNGLLDKSVGTPYAEKLLLFKAGQRLPTHFHYTKTEDIINRAGGKMWIELFRSTKEGAIDTESTVEVYMDGIRYLVEPGKRLILEKGQSITLTPGLYHSFGATTDGELIAGEVSSINDDHTDNHFNPAMPRYVRIEEDEAARYVLCNEYDKVL